MIIFTDIDDTIMKTARKITTDISLLNIGAYNHDGQPLSYIDAKRYQLIEQLLVKHVTIPVSARSRKSFDNLNLTFNHHAVLNFGATIIDKSKKLDTGWYDHIKNQVEKLAFTVCQIEIKKQILGNFPHIEYKEVAEDGVNAYLNFRDYQKNPQTLDNVKKNLILILDSYGLGEQMYFYQTDRDLALIPKFIKKELAVEYLLQNHYSKDDLLIGLGDHQNDLSFMGLCDFILLPTDSMLMKLIKRG